MVSEESAKCAFNLPQELLGSVSLAKSLWQDTNIYGWTGWVNINDPNEVRSYAVRVLRSPLVTILCFQQRAVFCRPLGTVGEIDSAPPVREDEARTFT